tara:strand:+ start:574 stop:813 length:240 start_codon:yes stop_codon:yes gene_type:complete
MEFIALVVTETGHSYFGPDPLPEVVAQAKEAIDEDAEFQNDDGSLDKMTAIWVLPYDVDEYPLGNADMAGEYFNWTREA